MATRFAPTWPVIDQVAGFPEEEGDEPFRRQSEAVICALREIRRTASEFGADPDDLTVVEHSGGGMIGARVALVDEPPWPGIDCDADIDHRPSKFIGLGRYAADSISAIVHDDVDEAWTRVDADATLTFEGENRCTYSGPSTWPPGATLVVQLENREDVEMWFALVSVRTDADETVAQLLDGGGEVGVDNPSWVDYGGFVLLEPRSTGLLHFVLAEGDQRFVIYCHPDPEANHPWANWMFPAGVLTPDVLRD